MKLEDIKVLDHKYDLSLAKLIGKQIKDIRGYMVKDHNYGDVIFSVCNVQFEDFTLLEFGVTLDHVPYLQEVYSMEQPNFDRYTLCDLLRQQQGENEG